MVKNREAAAERGVTLKSKGEALLRKSTQWQRRVLGEEQWRGKVSSSNAKALKGKRKEAEDHGSEKENEKS